MIPDTADGPGIGINGFLTFALKLEQAQVTLIKPVKSIYF